MKALKQIVQKVIRLIKVPFILRDYFAFKLAVEKTQEKGAGSVEGADRSADNRHRFSLSLKNSYPCIRDKTITTRFDRHYVYHTAWAARKVKEINPSMHVDISSSLYFCGIVSAFVPVEFYDYRPAQLNLSNLESKHGDLMHLPFADNCVHSISCMHTIEHIGLGRYGDPLDPEGDRKAMRELIRVTKPGGSILFVTPIGGKSLIEYNAHRIYTYAQIISYFNTLELKEFSFIPEHESSGGIKIHADETDTLSEHYGCGCFWFQKR